MTSRSERLNSILMTWHYRELGSASDWLKQISLAARPIRSTTKIWVVTRHQYGIYAFAPRRHYQGKPVVAWREMSTVLWGYIFYKVWDSNWTGLHWPPDAVDDSLTHCFCYVVLGPLGHLSCLEPNDFSLLSTRKKPGEGSIQENFHSQQVCYFCIFMLNK